MDRRSEGGLGAGSSCTCGSKRGTLQVASRFLRNRVRLSAAGRLSGILPGEGAKRCGVVER